MSQMTSVVIAMLVCVAQPVSSMQGGGVHHILGCGKNKAVYTDSPGTNTHSVNIGNSVPSDPTIQAQLEQDAADDWRCSVCPPTHTGCEASVSSTYTTMTYVSTGGGNFTVTTEGLVVTFHCSACTN